ncbi:glycosyltransferase [Streptomyces sp. NRRL S-920]|uniref:glycosyltransferase n=1 Tax=Streptomyces sp. NRRL S-920 TaxID=1463921 RepID=UPI0004CB6DE5|nr:glycosyltransferase [Streptomyces sp. NRRL S-920]
MRLLLVTWGSTGDVAPYVGLGVRLVAAGQEVVVATSERHAPRFRLHNMPVHVLPLARQEESALAADRFDRWQSPARLRRRKRNAQDIAQVMARGVLEATGQGVDAILAHPLAHPVCAVIAEGTGLPCTGIYTAAPGMLLPRLSAAPALSPHGYRLAETLTRAAMSPLYAPALSWVRQELGMRRGMGYGVGRGMGRPPAEVLRHRRVLHGYSSALLPKGHRLPDGHACVGYWWPARDPHWRPDERLLDFLASGPAPVYFGFGSVSPGDAERLSDTIRDVVRRLGVRAVVQAGWQGLDVSADDVLTIGECPHDWLFPRMRALVHHAGPGTAGAGLRAGVPAVPVPLALDQPFWAHRLTSLGLAPTSLPARRLTARKLAGALRTTLYDDQYRARCARLSKVIGAEDGAASVLGSLARA